MAKCDAFIVSRIIFSLVFARLGGRNDYISFSINIGTNKLEHDPQDTRVRFFQIFSLRVPSRRRTCQHLDIVPRATSHLCKPLKSRPNILKYTRKLTYTPEFNHVQVPQFSPNLNFNSDDNQLSHILPKFLQTIPRLFTFGLE